MPFFIAKLKDKVLKKDDPITDLILEIESIRNRSTILNLCASATGYSWLGVRNAGFSLFPNCSTEIPQYYSNQVLTNKQLIQVGQLIGSLKFEQLIFNGFNAYFEQIITAARSKNTTLKVGVIHHGFFAELSGNPSPRPIVEAMIKCYKAGNIDKIGFLKTGNPEVFLKLFGIKPFLIFNKNPPINGVVETKKRIGVLTSSSFRKNTFTQAIAALCIEDHEVVMTNASDVLAFDSNNKIVELGHLSHDVFLKELSCNMVNSHVTFSEASGGQVFTESLALGVPCLTAFTHGYLDDSEELQKALIVDRFDDAWAIAEKMKETIANRAFLSKLGITYSLEMNKKADELLEKFLYA